MLGNKSVNSQAWIQVLGLSFVLLFLNNCSGDQQQEEIVQQEVQESSDEEASVQDSEGEEEMAQEEATQEEDVMAEEPVDDMAASELEPMTGAGLTNAAPTAERVVRYVSEARADIYSDTSGSQVVGNLRKGDRVLVIMEGDWAKISDTMFLKGGHLSDRAVAREQTKRKWLAPSH